MRNRKVHLVLWIVEALRPANPADNWDPVWAVCFARSDARREANRHRAERPELRYRVVKYECAGTM
jgi:hypothetical protein